MTEENVYWGDGGFGFIANGKLYLKRCGKCRLENYGPSVSKGECAWCGDKPDREALQQHLRQT